MNTKDRQRRSEYKLRAISASVSQQRRREQALEVQKQKRALKIDSTRSLDGLLDLTLDSASDSEHEAIRTGVATLVPLVQPAPDGRRASGRAPKTKPRGRWAEKCMFAELLELTRDEDSDLAGGLPPDLQTNWIALSPIPKGKRCLLVTAQTTGNPAQVPATLHSRVKGKRILSFPSPLPPNTILDCILDEHWKHSGVVFILDVIRWHGQDIAESESAFRFWWRDARIAEIQALRPPQSLSSSADEYQFPFPVTFLPVPTHTPLPIAYLVSTVIPDARSQRTFQVPCGPTGSKQGPCGMDVDANSGVGQRESTSQPDGLLLYWAPSAYEYGTSPMSLWVPVTRREGGTTGEGLDLQDLERILGGMQEQPSPVQMDVV